MNQSQQLDAILGRGMTMEVVGSSAVTSKTFDVLIVNQAATFSVLTDDSGQNLLSTQPNGGLNLSGVSCQTGMIIAANNGRRITAVTCSAGNVFAYTMQQVALQTAS